jgi:hypothetical protein
MSALACSHPFILAMGMLMSGGLVGATAVAILAAGARADRDDELLRRLNDNVLDPQRDEERLGL